MDDKKIFIWNMARQGFRYGNLRFSVHGRQWPNITVMSKFKATYNAATKARNLDNIDRIAQMSDATKVTKP
jgi:hypothetical protein